jgi:hypothetical protein
VSLVCRPGWTHFQTGTLIGLIYNLSTGACGEANQSSWPTELISVRRAAEPIRRRQTYVCVSVRATNRRQNSNTHPLTLNVWLVHKNTKTAPTSHRRLSSASFDLSRTAPFCVECCAGAFIMRDTRKRHCDKHQTRSQDSHFGGPARSGPNLIAVQCLQISSYGYNSSYHCEAARVLM